MTDGQVMQSAGFVIDLGRAFLSDEREAAEAAQRANASWKVWSEYAKEFILARWGIGLQCFHYFPSMEACVFVCALQRNMDRPTGGTAFHLRWRMVSGDRFVRVSSEWDVTAEADRERPVIVGEYGKVTALGAYLQARTVAHSMERKIR